VDDADIEMGTKSQQQAADDAAAGDAIASCEAGAAAGSEPSSPKDSGSDKSIAESAVPKV
jgi:hypothetical protein